VSKNANPVDTNNNREFRVVIRGLKLDQTTRALMDAAIRSAVMQEIAALGPTGGLDLSAIKAPADDPTTRSFLNAPGKVLGMILIPKLPSIES
jgi:hypothetical protein